MHSLSSIASGTSPWSCCLICCLQGKAALRYCASATLLGTPSLLLTINWTVLVQHYCITHVMLHYHYLHLKQYAQRPTRCPDCCYIETAICFAVVALPFEKQHRLIHSICSTRECSAPGSTMHDARFSRKLHAVYVQHVWRAYPISYSISCSTLYMLYMCKDGYATVCTTIVNKCQHTPDCDTLEILSRVDLGQKRNTVLIHAALSEINQVASQIANAIMHWCLCSSSWTQCISTSIGPVALIVSRTSLSQNKASLILSSVCMAPIIIRKAKVYHCLVMPTPWPIKCHRSSLL